MPTPTNSRAEAISELVAMCANCAYSDADYSPTDPKDGDWLLCRRRAPAVFELANDGYDGGDAVFPRVDRTDWCGEWVMSREKTKLDYRINYLDVERV